MTTASVLVLAIAVAFQGDPADLPIASVVSVLPLPPSPPYVENDPRVRTWFHAFCLALRIDDRGRMLARGGLPPDVAEELRFANYRDFEQLVELLARLESSSGSGRQIGVLTNCAMPEEKHAGKY